MTADGRFVGKALNLCNKKTNKKGWKRIPSLFILVVGVNATEFIKGLIDALYYLNLISSETVSFLRPFALRAAKTLRPLAVDIL